MPEYIQCKNCIYKASHHCFKAFFTHMPFIYRKSMHDWPKAQKIDFEILSETTGKLQKCV